MFCHKFLVPAAHQYLQIQEIADEYLERIDFLDRSAETKRESRVAMVSSVTAIWIQPEVKPEYWFRNLISPILLADALATTIRPQGGSGVNTVVEGRSYSSLQAHIRKILISMEMCSNFVYASLLSRGMSAVESLLGTMGCLHSLGHPLVLGHV